MIEKTIRRFISVVKIASHPRGGLGYLRQPNASIASFNILDQLSRYGLHLDTIVDVGANQGQFATAAKQFYPEAEIHSFEPVPETYEKLEKYTGHLANLVRYNYGLGRESGAINFYQNEHSHASSALPISDFQKSVLPETAKTKLIKVPVKRLEEIAGGFNLSRGSVLLKLDVQGFEKEVLMGAGPFLNRVDYLLFEASFVPMYEGEPLFDEMHKLVTDFGFKLMGPVGSLETSDQRTIQLDMLYKKSHEND